MQAATRKLDKLGRLCLPSGMRQELGLTSGESYLDISLVDGRTIVIRRHHSECVLCGRPSAYLLANGSGLCATCYEDARAARPIDRA